MTNKYENFINKLRKDTEEKKIQWNIGNYSYYDGLVSNPDLIIRAFYTDIGDMRVLLLEGKESRHIDDFDSWIEFTTASIILIKSNIIAKTLDSDNVNVEYIQLLIDEVAITTTGINDDINNYLDKE